MILLDILGFLLKKTSYFFRIPAILVLFYSASMKLYILKYYQILEVVFSSSVAVLRLGRIHALNDLPIYLDAVCENTEIPKNMLLPECTMFPDNNAFVKVAVQTDSQYC